MTKFLIVLATLMVPALVASSYLSHNTGETLLAGGKHKKHKDHKKKKCPPKHHHHNHGAHLSVIINLNDPIIQKSDDDPGWVLVQAAQEQKLNIEIDESKPIEGTANLQEEVVVIPTDACLEDYIDGLKRIRFVKDVKVLPEEGDKDE